MLPQLDKAKFQPLVCRPPHFTMSTEASLGMGYDSNGSSPAPAACQPIALLHSYLFYVESCMRHAE